MNAFLWNLLLAITWVAISNDVSLFSFVVGFAVGFFVLFLVRSVRGRLTYFRKTVVLIQFFAFMTREIFVSTARVAADVITRRHRMKPGILAVPLAARTDAEITVLAAMISLTPGSLTVDISDDRRFLYVHVMYLTGRDIGYHRREIKERFERRVLELMR